MPELTIDSTPPHIAVDLAENFNFRAKITAEHYFKSDTLIIGIEGRRPLARWTHSAPQKKQPTTSQANL